MSIRSSIKRLSEVLQILQQYENHTPPPVEIGFYRTFNNSIVYISEIDHDHDGRAVILSGGIDNHTPGDSYWIVDGYHRETDIGSHLVLGVAEKLDLTLPEFPTPST